MRTCSPDCVCVSHYDYTRSMQVEIASVRFYFWAFLQDDKRFEVTCSYQHILYLRHAMWIQIVMPECAVLTTTDFKSSVRELFLMLYRMENLVS